MFMHSENLKEFWGHPANIVCMYGMKKLLTELVDNLTQVIISTRSKCQRSIVNDRYTISCPDHTLKTALGI